MKKIIKNYFFTIFSGIKKSKFLGFGFFLTFANILIGVLGYTYQILVGRLLQPSEFAKFSAIMGLFMFLSAPMGAVSILIIRQVSALKAKDALNQVKSFFFQVNKNLFILSLVFILLYFLSKDYIQTYLRIESRASLIIFFMVLLLSFFYTAIITFIQGMQRFYIFGFLGLFLVALKILFSYIFISAEGELDGALLGILCAFLIVNGIGAFFFIRLIPVNNITSAIKATITPREIVPVLVASISYAAMTQLDMVIVNWYFPAQEAGMYAAASVLGKAVLYLPGGLSMVLLPIVAENFTNNQNSYGIFKQAIKITIISCGLVALFYLAFGDYIIQILYGEKYTGAGAILKWYGFAMLPLSMIIIAEQYLLARNKVFFAWIFFLLLPVQLLLMYYWHSNFWMILVNIFVIGLILCVIGFAFIRHSEK